MLKHHRETIENARRELEKVPGVLAVLLGGSIAHGYARPDSDVDLAIVVDRETHARKRKEGQLTWYNPDLATYEGGYVDAKFLSLEFMESVAARGSEPARYAFQDARIVFSRLPPLEDLLARITAYPVHRKAENRRRFLAQLEAWKWHFGESRKVQNPYLQCLSLQKIILFSSRIVLTENERLYPYHKWMLKEVERASSKPDGFIDTIDRLLREPDEGTIASLCKDLYACYGMDPQTVNWSHQFLLDSELNWMDGFAPVDDL